MSILVPILSAVLGAGMGGWVVHRLALVRELQGERRSRRIDHLIEAWRGLMAVANRKDAPTPDQNDAFEAALTDIMLLGEAAEIHATESFIRAAGRSEPTNLDAIVNALRKSLRDELQLGEVALPQDRVLRIDWSDLRGQ